MKSSERFDNYLSAHLSHLGSGQRFELRTDALRANYSRLLSDLDPSAAVLEIGPGMGELLALMRDTAAAAKVTAIDLSPEVVTWCSRLCENVLLVEDTAQFLRERESTYDLIILLHVLEHVPRSETIGFLSAIRQALRPNGRVIIEVPNMANPVNGLTSRYADFTHEVGFTESSLRQVLRMAGFGDIDIRPFRIPRSSLARWIQWAVRGILEKAFLLLAMLYSRKPELNSANIVGIARKS